MIKIINRHISHIFESLLAQEHEGLNSDTYCARAFLRQLVFTLVT